MWLLGVPMFLSGENCRWRKGGKPVWEATLPRIIWGKAYRRVTLAWRKTELAVKLVDDPSPLDRITSCGCRIRSGVTIRSAALGGDGREAWGPRPDQILGPSGRGLERARWGIVGEALGHLEPVGGEKTGRIRTSLRALPDLAAVVWRVGEVAGRRVGSTAQVQSSRD